MAELPPGHYWKTPFFWEPGATPPPPARLRFEPAEDDWLRSAIGQVMAAGTDASDLWQVPRIGLDAAVQEVFDLVPARFERPDGWWRAALDAAGQRVGFVLPVLFAEERFRREGRPQGTILYMGVLPPFRGRGHAVELVHEAVRLCSAAGCWRLFCDTGTDNRAMVAAFRRAGHREAAPWARPLA